MLNSRRATLQTFAKNLQNMKTKQNTKTRIATFFLAVISLGSFNSCAVSEDRAGTTGAVIGGGAGAVIGNQLGKGKFTGSTTGDTLLGGILGAGIGQAVGQQSTTLKGQKKTEVPNQ